MNDRETGFDAPQRAKTEYMASLYEKHDLGLSPSLKDIEPVATKLLGNSRTALAGAELVLGRRVDAKEVKSSPHLASIIISPVLSGEDRFGLLLMEKAGEQERAGRG